MSAKRNILLVDDSEKFACQVQLVLLTNGNTGSVEIATTLNGAREILAKENTHLIISDIKLAEGNTLSLIQSTKKTFPSISVIILTNHFDELHRAYAREAGADFFIDKSMAFYEIPRALAKIEQREKSTPLTCTFSE